MVVGVTEFVFVAIAFFLVLALFALLYSSKFFQISLVRSRRPPIEPVEPETRAPKGRKAQKQLPQGEKITGKPKSGRTQPQQRKVAGKNQQQASNQWVVKDTPPDDIVGFYNDIRGQQARKKKVTETKVEKEAKTVKPKAMEKAEKDYQEVTKPKKEKKPRENPQEKRKQKKEKKEKEVSQEPEIDLNEVDEKGDTPLHRAAAEGNKDLVGDLLKKGAKAGVQNKRGNTPLHLAAENNHAATSLRLLSNHPEAKNVKNYHGHLPEELTSLNWLKEKLIGDDGVTLKVIVPLKKRGALLGFRGTKVAEISTETGTVIKVPPRDSEEPVSIFGRKDKAEKAKAKIDEIVKEEDSERRYPVPKEKHGVIIGKGGWQLKLIENVGVRIIIPKSDSQDGDIRIRGKPEAVQIAIQKIEALLEKDQKRQQFRRPPRQKETADANSPTQQETQSHTEEEGTPAETTSAPAPSTSEDHGAPEEGSVPPVVV